MSQNYPLFATLEPDGSGDDSADQVWAIIGWQQPDLPGQPLDAVMVALGSGPWSGQQETGSPDTVWPSAEAAERFLAGARRPPGATMLDDADGLIATPEERGER